MVPKGEEIDMRQNQADGSNGTQPDAGEAASPTDVVNPEVLPVERMNRHHGGMVHLNVPTILRCPAFWFAAGAVSMGAFVYLTRKER
jgi:hypothetical protein